MDMYYQGISAINGFLKRVQKSGLAGQITHEKIPEDGDIGTWTGSQYQLGLCGSPEKWTLELRQMRSGQFQVLRTTNRLLDFERELMFFVVEEG